MATTPGGKGEKLTAEKIAAHAFAAGFRGEALVNAVAIALAESGGWTGAHNPKGEDSRGLWQINVAPNVRANKWGDLSDPAVNARAAFEVSGGGKNFNPWTTYAGSTEAGRNSPHTTHLAAARRGAAAAEGPGGSAAAETGELRSEGGGAPAAPNTAYRDGAVVTVDPDGNLVVDDDVLPANATDAQIEAWIRKHYSDVAGFLDNPDIRKLLFQAARDDLDDTEVEALLRKTDYYKTHGPDSRRLDLLIAEDRVAAVQLIGNTKNTIQGLMERNGIEASDAEIGEMAKKAIREGWIDFGSGQITDPAKMNDFTAYLLRLGRGEDGALPGGEASFDADGVQALAKNYLVPISRRDAEDWALRIMEGNASEESLKSWLNNLARARFAAQPDIVAALEAGSTPSQFFAGHRATVAKILELDDGQVDLMDPKYSWAMEMVDDKGNRRAPTLGEVAQLARDRPEFSGTRAYKSTESEYALGVSKFLELAA